MSLLYLTQPLTYQESYFDKVPFIINFFLNLTYFVFKMFPLFYCKQNTNKTDWDMKIILFVLYLSITVLVYKLVIFSLSFLFISFSFVTFFHVCIM